MSRYTFTCEHFEYDDFTGDEVGIASKTTTEFRADELTTMLENFESFLRASGYHFDGYLTIANDEEIQVDEERSVWNRIVEDHLTFLETQSVQGNCEICKLPKAVMASHSCFEKNCPVHNAN
jgi:hypothetical protein